MLMAFTDPSACPIPLHCMAKMAGLHMRAVTADVRSVVSRVKVPLSPAQPHMRCPEGLTLTAISS